MNPLFVALFAVLVVAALWGGVMTAAMWRTGAYPMAVAWAFTPLVAVLGMVFLARLPWGEPKQPAPEKK